MRVEGDRPRVRLVYLDQNVLSAAARDCDARVTGLATALMAEIRAGQVLVPSSPLHLKEAALDSRLYDRIAALANQLADGVEFLHWHEVAWNQVLTATEVELSRPLSFPLPWSRTFTRDPQEPRAARYQGGVRVFAKLPLPDAESVERDRAMKSRFAGQPFAAVAQETSDADLLREEADSAIEALLPVPEQELREAVATGDREAASRAWLRYEPTRQLCSMWSKAGRENAELAAFVHSDRMRALPLIHTLATLYAWKRRHGGLMKQGDIYDTFHIATALPHVDALILEAHWADVVRQTKLDRCYNVEVFTMRKLKEFVTWIHQP
jgi:hypothetical protein